MLDLPPTVENEPQMIDVKQAVQAAVTYVENFGALMPTPTSARLEETEFDEMKDEWVVTMSFAENPISRTVKVFRINATDGTVRSMKSRISAR